MSNIVYLTRIEHFNAAHRLVNPNLTEQENIDLYGKCTNPNYHGHNYSLEVTIKAPINVKTGFTFNAKTLSTIIQTHIVDAIDHKNLNVDVPFMKGKFTSVECLIVEIWNILYPILQQYNVTLHKLLLRETHTIYAEYFG